MKNIVRIVSIVCIILGFFALVSGLRASSARRACIGGLTIVMSTMTLINISDIPDNKQTKKRKKYAKRKTEIKHKSCGPLG